MSNPDDVWKTSKHHSLRDRIAAVQVKHHHWDYAGALTCACGEDFGLDTDAGWEAAVQDWAQHLADAVIAALGLQPHLAKRIINGKPDQWVRRHVTDWEIVDV